MTARQRTKRMAYWRGSAWAFTAVTIFCLLLAATDAIQQL